MKDLRQFITLVEDAEEASTEIAVEEIEEADVGDSYSLAEALSEMIFKLRAHSEMDDTLTESYCSGIEAGCEMAANMIENLVKNINGGAVE